MDWEAAKPLLDAPLDATKVKKPSGNFGPKGDYIEGWHAIAEANRIFGHGNWSYTITRMNQDHLAQAKTSKGDDQWQAAYTCIVRLVVGEAVREDVGFGSGFAKQIGDAIEGATKEAATDALKRCLRTFGNPFGLALYDKTRANVAQPKTTADKVNEAETLEAINALIPEVRQLGEVAVRHLHQRATGLGLIGDKSTGLYKHQEAAE